MLRQKSIGQSPSYETKIAKLQETLKQACLSKGESLSYCNTFLRSLDTTVYESKQEQYRAKMYIVADEINQIKQGQSFCQKLNLIVAERDEIVRQLRTQLINSRSSKQVNLTTACEKLENLRMYNLMIVENVQSLRKKLRIPQSPYFTENIHRINQDIDFLRFSALRRHIEFSNCNDPLFLIPLRKFWNLELVSDYHRRPIINLFSVDLQFRKRLEAADKIIKSIDKNEPLALIDDESQDNEPKEDIIDKEVSDMDIESQTMKETQQQLEAGNTIQKFILPTVYAQKKKRLSESKEKDKKKYLVSTLIKDVIQQYQEREKIKNENRPIKKDMVDKKRAVTQAVDRTDNSQQVSRSLERSPINLKTLDSKPLSSHQSFVEQDTNFNYLQKITRQNNDKLPQINHTKREDPLSESRLNQFDQQDYVQSHTDRKFQAINNFPDDQEPKAINPDKNELNLKKARQKAIRMKAPYRSIDASLEKNKRYKETAYKIFQQKESQEDSEANMKKLSRLNAEDIYYSPKGKRRNPQNSLLLEKIKHISQITNNNAKDRYLGHSLSMINDQKKEKSYKNPLDILREIRRQEDDTNSQYSESEEGKISPKRLKHQKLNYRYKQTNLKQNRNKRKLIEREQIIDETQPESTESKSKPKQIIKNQPEQQEGKLKKQQSKLNLKIRETYNFNYSNSIAQLDGGIYNIRNSPAKQEKINSLQMAPAIKNKMEDVKRTGRNVFGDKIMYPRNRSISEPQNVTNKSEKINPNPISFDRNQTSTNIVPQSQSPQQSVIIPPKNQPSPSQPAQNNQSLQSNQPIQDNQLTQKIQPAAQIKPLQRDQSSSPILNQGQNSQQPLINPQPIESKKEPEPSKPNDNSPKNQGIPLESTINKPTNPTASNTPNQPLTKSNEKEKIPSSNEASPVKQLPPSVAEQAAILQKCIFQSKSIQGSQLTKLISILSPSNSFAINSFISTQYFANRHIILTSCIYNSDISAYCLFHPHMTVQNRTVYILYFEIVKTELQNMEIPLLNTFVKYIFTNDPCEKIVFLKHNTLFNESHAKSFQFLKSYAGEITDSLRLKQVISKSYQFERKAVKCAKIEDFTTIFNTVALFTTPIGNTNLFQSKKGQFNFDLDYLRKLQIKLSSEEGQQFATRQQLDIHLQQQNLPFYTRLVHNDNLAYSSSVLEDCLQNVRFSVHANNFYFTVEPPSIFLLETAAAYFLLIATSDPKKFYILGDKLYEQAQRIDIERIYREIVDFRRIQQVFMNQRYKGKIVSCPQFKKRAEMDLGMGVGLATMELNWKEYIKGARYNRQEEVYLELVSPFWSGLVRLDELGRLRLLYSCYIGEQDCTQ